MTMRRGHFVYQEEEPGDGGSRSAAGSSGAGAGGTVASTGGGAASTGAAAQSTGASMASTATSTGVAAAASIQGTTATPGSAGASTGTVDITWPDGWREKVAKGDEKALARLKRYASPEAALEALSALQLKLNQGELRQVPKKDATPEEQAAYRASLGIPEKPADYKLEVPEGLVLGKDDKPQVDAYLAEVAHKLGLTNEQASANVAWYYEMAARQAEDLAAQDKAAAQKVRDDLQKEWGTDYRANMNVIHGVLDLAPPGVKDKVLGKRMEDGKGFANDPDVLRWLASIGRELNPAGAVAPGMGAAAAGAVETEIKAIEADMKAPTNTAEWKRYWKDEERQARLRELYTARDKIKGQG